MCIRKPAKDSPECRCNFMARQMCVNYPEEQKSLTLLMDSVSSSGSPAVVQNSYGTGKTIAFLYNLPESIVYTRQGNPAFAGLEKDGINGLRAMDLFTDGWLDSSKNTINQADEQMRLLTHVLEKLNAGKKPLPRFWYFPDSLKCLVTLTNDGEYNGEKDFEPQFRDIDSMGAKMSIYILETEKVSKEWTDRWTQKGHEIAGHPDDTYEAANPHWQNMKTALQTKKTQVAEKYGLPMETNVNHWFVWCGRDSAGNPDFSRQARLEAGAGIKMDINYAHYDMNSNQGHFLGEMGKNQGNFTGSGLVMKFAGNDGEIIPVYQHLNNVYDQLYMENKDQQGFFNCFKGLMDRSLNNEVYSYISVKAHNNEYYFSKKPLLQMLAYASEKGVPVWTAKKLLDFVEMKDEAKFENINWSGDRLTFQVKSAIKNENALTCMVPFEFKGKELNALTRNGTSQKIMVWSVKGTKYGIFTVTSGAVCTIRAEYQ